MGSEINIDNGNIKQKIVNMNNNHNMSSIEWFLNSLLSWSSKFDS